MFFKGFLWSSLHHFGHDVCHLVWLAACTWCFVQDLEEPLEQRATLCPVLRLATRILLFGMLHALRILCTILIGVCRPCVPFFIFSGQVVSTGVCPIPVEHTCTRGFSCTHGQNAPDTYSFAVKKEVAARCKIFMPHQLVWLQAKATEAVRSLLPCHDQ